MMHALYLGWLETRYITKKIMYEVLLPDFKKKFKHLQTKNRWMYFHKHVRTDFEVIQRIRNKNCREYDLFTSLLVHMSDTFRGFRNTPCNYTSLNRIALTIQDMFNQQTSDANLAKLKVNVKRFIKTSARNLIHEEKLIVERQLEWRQVESLKLNGFLFQHLRHTRSPSAQGLKEYLLNNKGLNEKHGFVLFVNEHLPMLDRKFARAFVQIRDMCLFMNKFLSNDFAKEEMLTRKVRKYIRKLGKTAFGFNFQKNTKERNWIRTKLKSSKGSTPTSSVDGRQSWISRTGFLKESSSPSSVIETFQCALTRTSLRRTTSCWVI
jgi:hypothetical protein